jgi:UDP-N-acetylmuramoyl-tripeptide--D-alanyl-D-alanine ligase
MKQRFKDFIVKILWIQVARLRKKHQPIVVAVAGSIGKTGTKSAVAKVLSQHFNVQWQDGNYNDITSVPLIFFGFKVPRYLNNPFGWFWILLKAELQIQLEYRYDVVVVEVGTDYRGNLDLFKKYLTADFGILTGISPEHMENFKDLDDVADEELTIAEIAEITLVNTEAVASKYQKRIKNKLTYGEGLCDCRITAKSLTRNFKRPVIFTLKDGSSYTFETNLVGKHNLSALAAAALIASNLELTDEEIEQGLSLIASMPGRMNLLKGIKGSLIIDDTYNSSPEAAIAALDTLYEAQAKQKIAILGQMNELGDFSKEMHTEVGRHCNPKQLKLVITIGQDANEYLAAAAEAKGCKVVRCPSPYHAADVLSPLVKTGTLILAKGSQNHVFAEEAVKELLENQEDVKKLVRQSRSWMKIKEGQFEA